MGVASDLRSGLPDELGEMAPDREVCHWWVGLAIITRKVLDLAIIEEIGNDGGDVVRLYTGRDVLAVPAATGRPSTCQFVPRIVRLNDSRNLQVVGVDAG